MATGYLPWAWNQKMIVKNIPDDWSRDMLENYMEVVMKAELASDGVLHFCNYRKSALLTFTEVLTEAHIASAETETKAKGKSLQFQLIEAPRSILVSELTSNLTHDNLLYYFDSKRSGGQEGGVQENEDGEGVEMFEEFRMAIVTFISPDVADGVLRLQQHQPAKGNAVRVEPCFEHFHKYILCKLTGKTLYSCREEQRSPEEKNCGSQDHDPQSWSMNLNQREIPGTAAVSSCRQQSVPQSGQAVPGPLHGDYFVQERETGEASGRPLSVSEGQSEGDENNSASQGKYQRGGKKKRNKKRNRGSKNQNQPVIDQNTLGQSRDQQGHFHPPSQGHGYRGRGRGWGPTWQGESQHDWGNDKSQQVSNTNSSRGRSQGWGPSLQGESQNDWRSDKNHQGSHWPPNRGRGCGPSWQGESQNDWAKDINQQGSYCLPKNSTGQSEGLNHWGKDTNQRGSRCPPDSSRSRGRGGRGGRGSKAHWSSLAAATHQLFSFEAARGCNSAGGSQEDDLSPVTASISTSRPVRSSHPLINLDADCNPIPCDEPEAANNSPWLEKPRVSSVERDRSDWGGYLKTQGPDDQLTPSSQLLRSRSSLPSAHASAAGSHGASGQPTQATIPVSSPPPHKTSALVSGTVKKSPDTVVKVDVGQHSQLLSSGKCLAEQNIAESQNVRLVQKLDRQSAIEQAAQDEARSKMIEEKMKTEFEQKAREENEQIQAQMKKLREDLEKHKQTSQEVKRQLEEEKRRAEEEKQSLQEEKKQIQQTLELKLERLQKQDTWREKFPPYKLRLVKMQHFGKDCTVCRINIREEEGVIEIEGPKDDLTSVKLSFLSKLQELFEDSMPLSPVIVSILRTPHGKSYFDQLCHTLECTYDVQDSDNGIVFAGFQLANLKRFVQDVKRNVYNKKFKTSDVPKTRLAGLKERIEENYPLARITLPSSNSDEIVVEGLDGDVDLALREVEDHCSQNVRQQFVFQVSSALQSRACKLWCAQELDDVKTVIWRNEGEIVKEDCTPSYKLIYRCTKEVQLQAQKKLQTVENTIKNVLTINLQDAVKSFTERILIIKGLQNEGMQAMSYFFEDKLKEVEGCSVVLSFNLPLNCQLPNLKYKSTRHQYKKPSRSHPQVIKRKLHHKSSSIRPFQAKLNYGSVTVKSGNIAEEQVDGIVVVVAEDMDLKKTAVGLAILKSDPQIADSVPQTGRPGQVTSILGSNQTQIFLAVLSEEQVDIAAVTQRCLQCAVQNKIKSFALPPLGCGRRFKYALDDVANAMAKTTKNFLQDNNTTLQEVYIVVYDKTEARKFRAIMKETISPPNPLTHYFGLSQPSVDSGSDEDVDDDADDGPDDCDDRPVRVTTYDRAVGSGRAFDKQNSSSEAEEELDFLNLSDKEEKTQGEYVIAASTPVPATSNHGYVQLCVQSQADRQDFSAVQPSLISLLKSRFVHEATQDMQTFKKLGSKAVEDIESFAKKRSVALSVQTRGGKDTLVVRGTAESVASVMVKVSAAIADYRAHEQKGEHQGHGTRGLPTAADRMKLPDYWKICQDGLFKSIEQFLRDQRKYGKLYTLSGSELNEVRSVIQSTWLLHLVGHGKDARNLGHRSIQVDKLERLENPNLWEMYCTTRDRLMRRVQSAGTFVPVEKVKGSTGGVKTTLSIKRHGIFSREIYPQVNEHYLFHGTKKEYIESICEQGLDCRVASTGAMLGQGIYASESSTKADQYTDDKAQRTSGNKTLILMRVLLGQPFINKAPNPPKYVRPPCKKCYKDHQKCQCKGEELFDSVIDDAGRNFREFVLYDRVQCYPEYIITYQRV